MRKLNNLLLTKKFAKKYNKRYPQGLLMNHVRLVRKFALKLAEIEGADKEVVGLAALLHDIGKYKDNKNHHEISFKLSKDFLNKLELSKIKKDLILKCILKHRFKFASENNEIEVKIIQSADALGTLFDDKIQKQHRKTRTKEDLLSKYDKTFKKINLSSAREIAKPQVEKLKNELRKEIPK
jgi:putative nucleotidyltransferase with HDIG domain